MVGFFLKAIGAGPINIEGFLQISLRLSSEDSNFRPISDDGWVGKDVGRGERDKKSKKLKDDRDLRSSGRTREDLSSRTRGGDILAVLFFCLLGVSTLD